MAQKSSKRQSSELHKTILMTMLAITAGFFGGWFGSQNTSLDSGDVTVTREIVESEGNLINTIATDVGPSVVSVNVTSTSFTQDFFGFGGRSFESESAGTGIILSDDGLIITNRHVLPSGLTNVSVTLDNGTELEAEVVGRTNDSDPLDIGFLKISDLQGETLTPVKIGDSDNVVVGERVVAIGNALGRFQNTVTSGIISGFGRDIEAFDGGGVETL